MNVLFIGGTGNISSDCARLLYERGHRVAVVTRGRSSVPPEYEVVRADRKDLTGMRQALARVKPDVVLNFLGYELADIETDYALFQGAVQQYVFISSATVYEKPPRQLPIREDAPLGNRFWEYARNKLACEEWLLARWQKEQFPVTVVRPSHTYSRRWVPNPVSSSSYSFALRLEAGQPVYVPDSGETPWTLTAASDFAVALAGLLGRSEALGEAYHITSDEVMTWRTIIQEIADALAAPPPILVPVPTDFICEIAPQMVGSLKGDKAHPGVFDNAKIKRLVPEFQCRKSFRVGIRESVAWLRAHWDEQNLNPQVDKICDDVIRAWQMRGQAQ